MTRATKAEAKALRPSTPLRPGAIVNAEEDAATLAQAEAMDAQAQALAAMHPLLQESIAMGQQLGALGVPWSFGAVQPGELMPSVIPLALADLLIDKGICTRDELDTAVYTLLRDVTANLVKAAKKRATGLIVPPGVQ